MTKTATKNFLGIPVSGDITSGRSRKEQGTLEEFGPILQAALDVPGLDSLRWRQYTPYFNDGEPCEFGIHDVGFKLTGGDEEAGDYEDGYVSTWDNEIKGGPEEVWDANATYTDKDWRGNERVTKGRHVPTGVVHPPHVGLDAFVAINKAVAGGRFYDVLLSAFGDHAIVTVSREGIEVETYEHD